MSQVDAAITEAGASVDSDFSEGQMVVFRLSEEEFGVDINNVKEIVRLPDITPIPRSPNYVSGICNLRGNVLPVTDIRIRFDMDVQEASDQTRLLVVEKNGRLTGMVVDQMREVMRVKSSLIEPPPAACRGIDREFLNGIVKIDDGKRLIMMLSLDEVINIDVATAKMSDMVSSDYKQQKKRSDDDSAEEHLVSFNVGKDEYAFDIARVREILKVTEITAVPNVPDYVLGLFTIRNRLLPIIDLRGLLGLPRLISERHSLIDRAIVEEQSWAEKLKSAVNTHSHFAGVLSAKKTAFGAWLERYNTSSVEVEKTVKELKRKRAKLYAAAAKAVAAHDSGTEQTQGFYEEHLEPLLNAVLDSLKELKTVMLKHVQQDQRILVVESDAMTIGYLVDNVDEVIRVPHSVIDNTPAMATSDRKELRAVAKLQEGKRLIMIMDEAALVKSETKKMLDEITEQSTYEKTGDGNNRDDKTLVEQSLDEEQLVTFSIDNEEYGIRIMQVQEINRIQDITHVPRAPYFIDGMTNLRGDVIPVINARKLFGLENQEIDDRTRVIIVDVYGHKTGLRVDQVNEVLRLAKHNIEEASALVASDEANQLIEGVCKIDDGKRMVLLIDMEHILGKKELSALKSASNHGDKSAGAARKRKQDKEKSSKQAETSAPRKSATRKKAVTGKKAANTKAK